MKAEEESLFCLFIIKREACRNSLIYNEPTAFPALFGNTAQEIDAWFQVQINFLHSKKRILFFKQLVSNLPFVE